VTPLDPARARILDAALAEFATHGFRVASTNAIAGAAGVAKGLVFHHFRSKEDLFLAVFDAVLARMIDDLYAGAEPLPADLFERLHAWALRKLRAAQRDPLGYRFIAVALTDAPEGLRARIDARLAALRAEHWPRMLAGVDASRLRKGVTLAQAIETLTYLGDGIERNVVPRLAALPDRGASQFAAIAREAWAHFVRLRDGLYEPDFTAPRKRRAAARPSPPSPPSPRILRSRDERTSSVARAGGTKRTSSTRASSGASMRTTSMRK